MLSPMLRRFVVKEPHVNFRPLYIGKHQPKGRKFGENWLILGNLGR